MEIRGNLRVNTLIDNVSYWLDSGVNGNYFATVSPAPNAYITGYLIYVKANSTNTAASTLNVNSLGAVNVYKNYNQSLGTSDIVSGQIFSVVYDGINFQLIGGAGGGSSNATVLMGNGDPSISSGSLGNFYWDSGNKFLYIKDNDGWTPH